MNIVLTIELPASEHAYLTFLAQKSKRKFAQITILRTDRNYGAVAGLFWKGLVTLSTIEYEKSYIVSLSAAGAFVIGWKR